MSVKIRYTNGPRNGKRGTLRNVDAPPRFVKVPANEAKAVGLAPGQYQHSGYVLDAAGGYAEYVWVGSGK